MQPFHSPTVSAGTAALDTLFQGSPAATPAPISKGGTASPKAPSLTEAPSSAELELAEAAPAPTEIGDHGKLGEVEGNQATENEGTEESTDGKPKAQPDWLEVPVTDDKGRRKVRVDLSNKEQLAKTLSMAYGFRKMQAERDKAVADLKGTQPRLSELQGHWDTLESAFQAKGIEGVVDILGGKKGHFAEWKKGELDREVKFQTASESEKREMQLQEKLDQMERANAATAKKSADDAKRAAADKEEAQLRSLESQVTPAFNKYRTAGTLGSAEQEAVIDQAIWDQALRNLEATPDTVELTPAAIEKEFRTVAMTFKAAIGKRADAKVKEVMDSKKREAQTAVAAAATRRVPASTLDQSMTANIRKGGVGGLTSALMDVLRASNK